MNTDILQSSLIQIELIHNCGGQKMDRTSGHVKIIPYPAVARIKNKITLIETIGFPITMVFE